MGAASIIVVKVGGSLYDSPEFGPGLRAFLRSLPANRVLLVPGGGRVADSVRELDAIHHLGEEAAHWIALRSLSVTAEFLRRVIGVEPAAARITVVDAYAFALEDEHRPGALPHCWDVTSDSIAARVAIVHQADQLILLKSIEIPPDTPWGDAAVNGWVDRHFPNVVQGARFTTLALNARRLWEPHR